MDFSQVKKWTIPQGSVKQVSANGTVIWKGTWKFTINLGNYVSKVKYTTNGGSSWTSITSNTTLELDSGVTLRVVAETYSSEPATYQYTYTMTDHNFDTSWTETSDNGSVTVYRRASAVDRYYTITWKNWNGTVLETDTSVIHDATPSYDSATPTRPTDAQYTYTFSGWSPSVHTVTGEATYTAYFQENLREYTLTITTPYGSWTRADYGETSSTFTLTVGYGTTIEKVGQEQGYDRDGLYIRDTLGTFETVFYLNVPQDDEYYTYNYTGITFPSTVTGNATVTANIKRIGKVVQVNFFTDNGDWSGQAAGGIVDANYGDVVSISGQTISFTNDYGTTTYTFTPYSDSYYYYTFDRITFTNNVDDQMILDEGYNEVWGYATYSPKPGTVSIAAGTGVSSVFLSTNSTATSGDPSGTSYPGGTTVYAFIVASSGYYSTDTYVGGGAQYDTGAIYRVGSRYVAGNGSFGTKSATRNPYLKWTGSNQSATLDGSAMASGTAYYVNYNSSHTVVATASSGYYISSSSGWTNSTTMTVDNSTVPVKVTRTATITSNTSWSTGSTAYYSITTSFNGMPYSGSISYPNGTVETISTTTSDFTKYYSSGTLSYALTVMSKEIYASSAGEVTSYGTLENGEYPYGYPADDRIITGYTKSPSSVTALGYGLEGNWLGSGTAYHRVVFSYLLGTGNTNHTLSVSETDSSAAYISGITHSTIIKNTSASAQVIASSSRLVFTNYSYKSSGALVSNDSDYSISPSTFTFADSSSSPSTVNVSYTELSVNIRIAGAGAYGYASDNYCYTRINYTKADGTAGSEFISSANASFQLSCKRNTEVSIKIEGFVGRTVGYLNQMTYDGCNYVVDSTILTFTSLNVTKTFTPVDGGEYGVFNR